MKKRIFIIFLTVIMFLVSGSILLAQTEKEIKGIITSGEAKVWIEPDRARVYLGIETMDTSVDAARETNAEKVSVVIEALKALKIEGMLVKAPSYNVTLVKEQEYDAVRAGRLPKIIGYKVQQFFTVLVQNKDSSVLSKSAASIIDTALRSGVNIIENVEFFKDDDSLDRRQALKLAVKNALDNAKAIAETANVTIKKYNMINSSANYWVPRYYPQHSQMMNAPSVDAGIGTTLLAGKIAVNANASLSCEIE